VSAGSGPATTRASPLAVTKMWAAAVSPISIPCWPPGFLLGNPKLGLANLTFQVMPSGATPGNRRRAGAAHIRDRRIEPVAEIWGSLDTAIDGRWENPVTVASQFTGFHKIEQLLWEDNTLTGAPKLCTGLVTNERQLLQLVRKAQYNPLAGQLTRR
jgi:hypothetical protein